MAEIALFKGGVAQVDDEDLERASTYRWRLEEKRKGNRPRYVVAATYGPRFTLHRFLLDAAKGQVVDHIDGDLLNNRRSNLRICSLAENAWNTGKRRDSKQPYKGVRRERGSRTWKFRIGPARSRIEVCGFKSAEEAAAAYDIAAVLRFGEFACLNFPHVFPEIPSRRKA